jgi:hypothetical protein
MTESRGVVGVWGLSAQSGCGLDRGRGVNADAHEVGLNAQLTQSVDWLVDLGDGPLGPSP